MVGMDIHFENEGSGKIVKETKDSIFIVSEFFTGWMSKVEYCELLGIEE